jgi:hypothetical protein
MQDEEDNGDHYEDVNETAGDVKDKESAQPGDEQNDGKYEQHRKNLRCRALHLVYPRSQKAESRRQKAEVAPLRPTVRRREHFCLLPSAFQASGIHPSSFMIHP